MRRKISPPLVVIRAGRVMLVKFLSNDAFRVKAGCKSLRWDVKSPEGSNAGFSMVVSEIRLPWKAKNT